MVQADSLKLKKIMKQLTPPTGRWYGVELGVWFVSFEEVDSRGKQHNTFKTFYENSPYRAEIGLEDFIDSGLTFCDYEMSRKNLAYSNRLFSAESTAR